MGPNYNASSLLAAVIAVAALLGAGPVLAWEEIEGYWCSEKEGCAGWDTQYAVYVIAGNRFAIQYRDTGFGVFSGKIHERALHERNVKWTITGKINSTDVVAGIAEGEFDARSKEPLKIKIKGTLKTKETAGSARSFEGEIADATAEATTRTIKGTIKGKVSANESVEGSFEGTLERPAQGWPIIGTYIPPPSFCSDAGRARSESQQEQREYRLDRRFADGLTPKNPKDRKRVVEVKARRLEPRTKDEKEQREARVALRGEGKVEAIGEGLLRTIRQRQGRDDREEQREKRIESLRKTLTDKGMASDKVEEEVAKARQREEEDRLTAVARPVSSDTADAAGYGKFVRTVKGTLSEDKHTITLDLPPLPVLNQSCLVMRTLPAQKLILEKQEPPRL